ncbi:hypothetical protein P4O66_018972, partial [Electrophorus voltai]
VKKYSPQSEENTAKKRRGRSKRKKSVEETEDDEQPGPSSSSSPNQQKSPKKPKFSSAVKRGEKLPVTCGNKKGTLCGNKLAKGGACIHSQGCWFTPSDFERFAGKGSWKNWKLSIRCQNTTLKKLIKGKMTIHSGPNISMFTDVLGQPSNTADRSILPELEDIPKSQWATHNNDVGFIDCPHYKHDTRLLTLARPLTDLFRGKTKQLRWGEAAERAFTDLKTAFSTAPVLQQPNLERPFTVEVDASDVGVGVVLSQVRGEEGKLRLIAYFSRKLSPSKRNYGVGDRELLLMKPVLEEWRHWLEGERHPFTIITDHKNL